MKESGKRGQNKREIILDAAAQVFSGKGYHNTRMEEIAMVAGIGKGTIYEYFDSKLQLFQAMMESSLQAYYMRMDMPRMETLTFIERMSVLFEAHITFCREHKELTRIIFWDTEIWDEELKDWTFNLRNEKEEKLTAIIRDSIKRGEIRDVHAKLLTLLIIGCLGSLWVPITLEDWDISPSVLAAQLTDIIMSGIKK
ncbi:TetR/AcrR family transcriptional regulator [Syntrophomonas curvata]